jgi:hypothetical protein
MFDNIDFVYIGQGQFFSDKFAWQLDADIIIIFFLKMF